MAYASLTMTLLIIGMIIMLTNPLRYVAERAGFPVLVGFMALGLLIRVADVSLDLLSDEGFAILEFLAEMGVFVLLFRVGLESKVARLVRWLPRASVIFVGDVALSGVLGFLGARYVLGYALITSLFVAVALTATSVGIAVSVWRDANRLESPAGDVMLDVAELDDLSGVLLMALLLAMAPALVGDESPHFLPMLGGLLGAFLLKLLGLGAFCALFSRYAEESLTTRFRRLRPGSGVLLAVLGMGLIIAAGAELMGFTVAIGAFFAGLIFSRDPASVKLDISFESLHDLFAPFFFVGIGLHIEPATLTAGVGPVAILLVVAMLGKLVGSGVPAWLLIGKSNAMLLGVSMVPRAEIALIVMQRGQQLGPWAVPPDVYTSLVGVSAILALGIPIVLRALFRQQPQTQELA